MTPKSSPAKQNPAKGTDLPPGLSQPALRALSGAGVTRLKQLTRFSEGEIKRLHGIGPNALEKLRHALAAGGLAYAATPQAGKPAAKPKAGKAAGARRR